ncbi:MAG: M48 family metallopeptidase [Breznakibacter sp.]
MNVVLLIMMAIVVFDFLFDRLLGYLNKSAWSAVVPHELEDVYPQDTFGKHQQYRRANYSFSFVNHFFSFVLLMAVLWFGGFALADEWAGKFSQNTVGRGLAFFAIIGLVVQLVSLPFSWYETFVIEARFGFNKSTPAIFWIDTLKSLLLGILIGAPLLAAVIWFYTWLGGWFWIAAWGLATVLTVVVSMFYTSLVLPLFNRQVPLPEGNLRTSIENMANKAGFKIDNVFVMDGSKRSTKANAFFSGFGPRKRIVLYDTLINDLTTEEITAVLAHEIGHYKLKHILWGTAVGVVQTGGILFLFSKVAASPKLSLALGAPMFQFHLGLVAFGLLFAPISMLLGLFGNWLSRRNEFAADAFAASHSDAPHLVSALKKLSANSLSNVTPHRLYVFFRYSHPPLLERIRALNR